MLYEAVEEVSILLKCGVYGKWKVMKYYNVTNAGGVKFNHVLQCLFQKNMYPALAPEAVGS